jgi:hypothetical protein
MKFMPAICMMLLSATLAGCAIMAARATDPEEKRQWEQAESEWEEFGQRLSAANAAAANAASSETQSPAAIKTTCFKNGERRSGLNKICYYNCLGSEAAVTINSFDLCPLDIER